MRLGRGDDSFNAAAGMAKPAYAAAYIRANMPFGVNYQDPVLTEQQAWDVAAYMDCQTAATGTAGSGIRPAIAAIHSRTLRHTPKQET
jgi:thiosulfate dehydrogenase